MVVSCDEPDLRVEFGGPGGVKDGRRSHTHLYAETIVEENSAPGGRSTD